MAQVLKSGARRPRIQLGGVYTGNNYDSSTPHERGVMPEMCYDLTVQSHANGTDKDAAYTLRLSEVEMLHVVQEWIVRFNGHQDQKRQSEAQKRARDSGEHLNMRDRGRS